MNLAQHICVFDITSVQYRMFEHNQEHIMELQVLNSLT